jgi:hypothetical protein
MRELPLASSWKLGPAAILRIDRGLTSKVDIDAQRTNYPLD